MAEFIAQSFLLHYKGGYMGKLSSSRASERKYQRFYLSKDEVPLNNVAPLIIYEKPDNPLTINSLRGINYQAVSKEKLAHNLIFQWHVEESLRREMAHERIRSNILARRMIENGLNAELEIDEIKEYEQSFATSIKDSIDMVMENAPRDIREEILTRVKNEMAKVSMEIKQDYEYNLFRIDTQLAYLDSLMADVVSSQDRRIPLKEKTSIMQRLAKEQREAIKMKKEILQDMGVNLKELGKSQEIKDDRIGGEEVRKYGKVNLSSLRGD
jgi:hypothetical protein